MIFLREILISPTFSNGEGYPYSVALFKNLQMLKFNSPITFLVGENGSGKSTLIEGIAKAVAAINIGSHEIDKDETLNAVQPLADAMRFVWNKRTHRGFFLRAEDYFGFVKRMHQLRQELRQDINQIDRDYQGRSDYAKSLAKTPAISSIMKMAHSYGEDLDASSHGESFLKIFQSRFVPGGLYLLDEPEAALSPISQLGLITLLQTMVQEEAQFIIATHSPIIMVTPSAEILDLDHQPPQVRPYDDIDSVNLYRDFLRDPNTFLRHL